MITARTVSHRGSTRPAQLCFGENFASPATGCGEGVGTRAHAVDSRVMLQHAASVRNVRANRVEGRTPSLLPQPRASINRMCRVLLSDRDIKAELDAGRIGLEPLDPEMVQPSSIDVRLDRYFRLFDNHKYPFIDPAEDQPDLTHLIEVDARPSRSSCTPASSCSGRRSSSSRCPTTSPPASRARARSAGSAC